MQRIKTSEDLCRMVNEELVSRSRRQQRQLRRNGTKPQYAPFRNPKIYREDYVREVLGIDLPLNESYPWSLKTRLLIEKKEEESQGFFSAAWDLIWGLPSRILGVLKGLKDLVMNPGKIKMFAKEEKKRVTGWLDAAKYTLQQYPGLEQKIYTALKAAVTKIESEKGFTAALGMVALSLAVRHRGVPMAKSLGVKAESRRYSLRHVLLAEGSGFTLSSEARDAIKTRLSSLPGVDAHLDNFLMSRPPSPATFNNRTDYVKMAMSKKHLRDKGRRDEPLTDDIKGMLQRFFLLNWEAVDQKKVDVDLLASGTMAEIPTKSQNLVDDFIKSLDLIAAGTPQSGMKATWNFLSKIGSGAGEGISTLWALVRKYGDQPDKPEEKETKPGELAPLDSLDKAAQQKIAQKQIDRLNNKPRLVADFKKGARPTKGDANFWAFEAATRALGKAGTFTNATKDEVKDNADAIATLMGLYVQGFKITPEFLKLDWKKQLDAADSVIRKVNNRFKKAKWSKPGPAEKARG